MLLTTDHLPISEDLYFKEYSQVRCAYMSDRIVSPNSLDSHNVQKSYRKMANNTNYTQKRIYKYIERFYTWVRKCFCLLKNIHFYKTNTLIFFLFIAKSSEHYIMDPHIFVLTKISENSVTVCGSVTWK